MEISICCAMYKQALLWISMAKYRNCPTKSGEVSHIKESRKFPLGHFDHHKSHMNYPRTEPGLLSEKPTTNPLNYGDGGWWLVYSC
jgi:hypothetical protein